MKFLLLLLTTILVIHGQTLARNPGLKIKLSESGLDYAAKVAVDKLSADVRAKKIPDFSGGSGRLSYGVSNIRIIHFTSPGSSVTTDTHNGITMTLRNVGISINGNWRYQWKWWFVRIRDSGSFDLSVSGVTLKLSLGMGVDRSGRPTLWIKSRQADIGNVHIRFHGGASWIYNLFSGYVERKIADKLRSRVNNKYENRLFLRIPVKDVTTIDYRLVAAPEIANNYVQSSQILQKGEFFWTSHNTGTPFLPPPMEELQGTPKMITLCLSDYVSNSLGYVLYRYGKFYLRHTLTESELPSGVRNFMNIANYPEIGKGQSTGVFELVMYATKPPTLHTDKNGIKGYLRGTVEVRTRLPTRKMTTLLTLDANATIDVVGRMTNETITAHVQNFGITTKVISPHVNSQTASQINSLMQDVSKYFIVPKLNDVGRIGYPLPVLDDVKYISPHMNLLKNTVCVSTDLKYDPSSINALHVRVAENWKGITEMNFYKRHE
ncbi:hypothetical protein LSH36_506g00024 [Paralvinella palmiformis]|uniref:Lipid-binding serum glycoprotein C-terminal domain-containing protein n=1 Tax=Paralvinella palmiformis TaxID=53620 RepID=A0AAD9J8P5_9ANNE|nr:hypothetical protein LSH36_506g00024 [Paralvinella palmiformis]